jgi:phage shock protein PspC (stress-responsive transcriptional regulator)
MKPFKRSYRDKKVAGICSGLGRYTKIDPTLWRLVFVGLIFTPFPITLIYIIAALITDEVDYTE